MTSIGVLQCFVPPLRAPATYTLLEIEPKQPLQSVTQRSENASLPTLEESPEELKKNQGKLPPALGTAERISLEKTHREIRDEIKGLGTLSDYDHGSKKHQRLLQLMKRDTELQEVLWGLPPITNATCQKHRMTDDEKLRASL